ncbi:MAG: hypothetical protein HQK52_23400, partial [Oligoflexia bacterium]|nr:hypothetical protein [Oligoflexia bacterium]
MKTTSKRPNKFFLLFVFVFVFVFVFFILFSSCSKPKETPSPPSASSSQSDKATVKTYKYQQGSAEVTIGGSASEINYQQTNLSLIDYALVREASERKVVKLKETGDYIIIKNELKNANAIVIRYSIPGSETGGGNNNTLGMIINGEVTQTIELLLTSRYSWLYGAEKDGTHLTKNPNSLPTN